MPIEGGLLAKLTNKERVIGTLHPVSEAHLLENFLHPLARSFTIL